MKKPLCALLALVQFVFCSPLSVAAPVSISDAEKLQTLNALGEVLGQNYIHEDKTDALHASLLERHASGAYDSIGTASDFAQTLSTDLIDMSQDFHFSVMLDPDWIQSMQSDETNKFALQEDALAQLERSNFGFRSLEILEGNIGYIRFDYFPDPQHAFEAGAQAMRFVENTEAVIFDIRYNRGGHNQFGQFITSFLYSASDHVMVHQYAYMDEGERISGEYWTFATLPGKRMPDIPVYVLTSTTTFSAGEWFAYELQKLGRATLVGQVTTGASHAVDRIPINDRFLMQVPIGIGRDPVDNSDFEGTGVTPDVIVNASDAKTVAHRLALQTLADTDPAQSSIMDWLSPVLEARMNAPSPSQQHLQRLAGQYEGREIKHSKGRLTYHWRERFQLTLIPLTDYLFAIEGGDDFRFRFVETNGRVSALERLDRNGEVTRYERR